ncbi:MAG: family 20 glycosylhydrolase [Spirochaetes bacterium]|nr:family 20 glycosylhydrolase [Spirochaetota bacterium]
MKRIALAAALLAALLPGQEEWTFELANRNDGPTIAFRGNKFSMGTSFTCVEKSWKTQYFWLQKMPYKVVKGPGSFLITSDPENPSDFFVDAWRLEARGNSNLRLTVDGTLRQDRDAMIEYIPLAIPSAFLEGATLEADGQKAAIGAEPAGIDREIKRLALRTRSGDITVEAVQGPGFKWVDRRAKPYKGREVFLVAVLAAPSIAKGERFFHELSLTASGDFRSFAALPALAPRGGDAPLRPTAAVAPRSRSLTICPAPRELSFKPGAIPWPDAVGLAIPEGLPRTRYHVLWNELVEALGTGRRAMEGAKPFVTVRLLPAGAAARQDLFEIEALPTGVVIRAATPAAVYYAFSTLLQMVDDQGALRPGSAKDWADFPVRAVHLLADENARKLHGLFITNVFGPLKVNHLVMEVEYVKWPSHPELHQPWGMTPEDLAAVCRLAEEHFIEVTPLFQTYGHSEYLFRNKANLDLAEDPGMPYAYDVSNPRTYEVMGELLADVRRAFPKARYLHIGHDEVTMRGKYPARPANLGKPLADLLWKDIQYYEAWAKRENLSLILWQDYLNGRSHPAEREGLMSVAKKLDRRHVISVWDYRTNVDFPEVDPFTALGFPVWGATGEEDIPNLLNFSRYAKAKGCPGMLHTTWTGYSGNGQAMFRYPKKLWPYVQAGASFWNAASPAVPYGENSFANRLFERVIAGVYPRRAYPRPGDRAVAIDLSPLANASLAGSGGFAPGRLVADNGVAFEIASAEGAAAAVLVEDGKPLRLKIGRRLKAVSLLYTSLNTDSAMREIGAVELTGGAALRQPLVVRREIGNLVSKIIIPGDVENGKVLTKGTSGEVYPVCQPAFSAGGRQVLWQYDLAVDGEVDTLTLTAAKNAGIVVAAVTGLE